jgi:hypothetical protein
MTRGRLDDQGTEAGPLFHIRCPALSRGLCSTMMDAVKAVTHDGRSRARRRAMYRRRLPALVKAAEIGDAAWFLMIAKGSLRFLI